MYAFTYQPILSAEVDLRVLLGVRDHVRKSVPPKLMRQDVERSTEVDDTGIEPVTYSFEGNRSTK